jgi:hypothetical protein
VIADHLCHRITHRQGRYEGQLRELGKRPCRSKHKTAVEIANRALPHSSIAAAPGGLSIRSDRKARAFPALEALPRQGIGAVDDVDSFEAKRVDA